jgi:fatty-acyl-CoA synthase
MSHRTWDAAGLRRRPVNFVPLSPISFLDRAEHVFPDRTALVYGGHTETWREHALLCRRFASALRRAGIDRGDVVALLMANTPPMLAAHFAVPMAGAVLNTINTRLDVTTVAYILDHCEARMLIVDAEWLEAAREAITRLASPPRMIVYTDRTAGFARPDGVDDFNDFVGTGDEGEPAHGPQDEWTPIAVNYTSGTTGRPKGVVYSHRGAYLSAVSTIVSWDVPKGAVYLWTLPLFHCNGWCMPWLLALQAGKSVCLRRIDPEDVLDLIVAEKVTHYCGAPIVHGFIRDAARKRGVAFDPPVKALIGGAPPPASLLAGMTAVGVSLTHIYGLTETYGPASICESQSHWSELDPAGQADRQGRQGVAYALQEGLTVMNPQSMQHVPIDGATVGEIMFRGNQTMMGYLKDPEATDRAFDGGWFHTGDLAVLEADSYARIKDRSKDIIISGGENISSVEVEDVLYSHPAISAAAVVAMPDEKWGEVPVAFVELREETLVREADLVAHCRGRLAGFKCPKRVVTYVLPKTSTGKIQKNVLRDAVKSNSIEELRTTTVPRPRRGSPP